MNDNLWGHRFISRDLLIAKQNPSLPLATLNTFWHSHEPQAGNDVDVYLVDTGVLQNHDEFSGNIELLNTSSEAPDEIGHGTAIASLICGQSLGSAPHAKCFVLKVFDSEKTSTQARVIEALKLVLEHHQSKLDSGSKRKSIVNLSLATSPSKDFISILEQLAFANVLIILSNDNHDRSDYIFSFENVDSILNVGAIKSNMEALNTKISEIYAPGESIRTAIKSAPDAYFELSGNSIAAGFVTGIAAALWSKVLDFTAAEIRQHILNGSETLNGLKLIKRSHETFSPLWSTSESGIVETFKPHQHVVRKLRCKNPAKGPMTFTLVHGALPPGLSLSENGIISGTVGLETTANSDHLNYFSTIIRADNGIKSVDRNLSFIVTENMSRIRQDNHIISAVQLAKCNGTDTIIGITSADNQSAPGQDAVNAPPALYDGYIYVIDPGNCCFSSSSLVRLSDHSTKKICDIKSGEFILQGEKYVKVVANIAVPFTKSRRLFQINDKAIFVTDEHPLCGLNGEIFAIEPNRTPTYKDKKVILPLEIGTVLKTRFGSESVFKIAEIKDSKETTLYHLFVEGDGSYYVGDILTYKKHDGEISSLVTFPELESKNLPGASL